MTEIKGADFPVWFDYEIYNDSWDLNRNARRALERALDIDDEEAKSFFGGEGKYMMFSVWFKITENGDIKGPYREKEGEEL